MDKTSEITKPHGFTGQRMIMVPSPVRQRGRSHPLLTGLFPVGAGFFPSASGHRIDRPIGADSDLLIVCLRGKGKVTKAGETVALTAGNAVWLRAFEPHHYEADPADPWTIQWMHFDGDEVEHWRQFVLHGLPIHKIRIPVNHLDDLSLDRIHGILENGYSIDNLIEAANAIRTTLITFQRLASVESATETSSHRRVAASVERLRKDFRNLHRVNELAEQCGLSISHYNAIFQKLTGSTPIAFLIQVRIQRASELLLSSTLSVEAVARQSGYDDMFYFSRCFRKITGLSPRRYRNEFRAKT